MLSFSVRLMSMSRRALNSIMKYVRCVFSIKLMLYALDTLHNVLAYSPLLIYFLHFSRLNYSDNYIRNELHLWFAFRTFRFTIKHIPSISTHKNLSLLIFLNLRSNLKRWRTQLKNLKLALLSGIIFEKEVVLRSMPKFKLIVQNAHTRNWKS